MRAAKKDISFSLRHEFEEEDRRCYSLQQITLGQLAFQHVCISTDTFPITLQGAIGVKKAVNLKTSFVEDKAKFRACGQRISLDARFSYGAQPVGWVERSDTHQDKRWVLLCYIFFSA